MHNEQKIRVGLIGVGNWARYGHIPALQSLSDQYTITAVCSRTLAKEAAEKLLIRVEKDGTGAKESA